MDDVLYTFSQIKAVVHSVLPDAKIFLFGSRANGTAHEESDWDILVLLNYKPDNALKNMVHNAVFPLSITIAAHISTIILSEEDWNNSPSWYSLHLSVSQNAILA